MMGLGVEFLCLVGDAALVALLYRLYKKCVASSDQVKLAKTFVPGPELMKKLSEGSIAYACVEGVASPVGRSLPSHYKDGLTGVVQTLVLVEHRSKRTQGFWSDVKKILRDTVNNVPFVLTVLGNSARESNIVDPLHQIHVVDPLSADFLLDSLTETHDHFEPEAGGLLSRGIDRIFGEVTKGIQETEKMLPVGASVLGIGKLVLESTKVKLIPPTGGERYILTQLSKPEVLKQLESKAFIYKVLIGFFGSVGVVILIFWLRKFLEQWFEEREEARLEAALETARLQRHADARSDDDTDSDVPTNQGDDQNTPCVICLENERNVILLNCGHICICATCVQNLAKPRNCPVCRARVERILPVYTS